MTPVPKVPTKLRVLDLLLEGKSVRQVAERLGISRQAVGVHARKLEGMRAIQRVPGTQSPILYAAGPKAKRARELLAQPQPIEGVDTQKPSRLGPWRAHRGEYKLRVVGGPDPEPAWAREWVAKQVVNRRVVVEIDGRPWAIRDIRGKRRHTLLMQPPEEYVTEPEEIQAVEAVWARRAALVARKLSKAFNYTFAPGEVIEQVQPIEYAMEAPGLPTFGVPGTSPVWGDESPGKGRPEVETQMADAAAAVASLPEWRARIEEQVGMTENEMAEQREVLERVVALQRRMVEERRLLVEAAAGSLPAAGGAPPAVAKAPVDGPEVA